MTETEPRGLWVIYKDTTEPELIVEGATTDVGILALAENVHGRESDAWLLSLMGQLPDWWRLVDTVLATNLTESIDQEMKPGDDARQRWEGVSVRERVALQRGWRVVQGREGGHLIYRVPNDPGMIQPVPVADLEIVPIPTQTPESELIVIENVLLRV